ncbi:hypothetical protein K5I29_11025 [Flavobacterium agricola]|uniref:Uncharacterized protein n=1 Tax=Flavobacterium agricola TaxID=2870839 RepID=A0ABY6M0S2_9FLAO|nr:DUF4175 family protein [Flavobacterium agricola]UYW01015.1 hypothetical protein K5I29_11025 [Flavobacterium agricola]
MDAIQIIYLKLNAFYKKFYINKLLKGCMLFVAIGLLYFIFTSLLENFLWLHTTTRAILFFVFLGIEILLFVNFIGIPLFQLNKIAKGISYQEAAEMLQKHFPDEVGDKLKNVLQLNALQANNNSDLLAASIQQKTDDLKSVPFTQAINFKSNLKFVPFLALPFLVLFLFFIGGKIDGLFSGFHRVAQYDQVFEKPAPFVFVIENANLAVKENEDFTLNFKTTGNIIPDAVTVNFNNQSYYAEKIKPGYFKFTFNRVGQNLPFYLEANSFTSKSFTLQILPVPAILDLQLQITTPKHVGQNFVKTSNSGNVLVPEGSVISWEISANHTDQLVFISDSVSQNFNKKQNQFTFSKKVLQALPYQLVAKNNAFHYDQQVSYQIEVIKDQFPQLSVQQIPDSIAGDKIIFHGKASDDYGISALRVVYYDVNHPQKIKLHNLPVSNKTATSFVYAFPDGLQLQPEISYSYYFEVLDNDAVNHFKATQSNRFVHNELNAIQKLDHNLTQQMDNINALQKSLSDSKNADKKATEVNQLLKQTTDLDYKGIKKLQDFFDTELQNQKAIDAAAQKFAEKLAEKNDETDNEKAKELEKRLENLRKEQELNKKLYEQLQKYTDKLTNEDLLQLMEQAKQNSKQQKRSLEQLVEQTKRFYVEQKAEQLGKKIADLASRQEKLQTEKQTDTDKQEQLNKAFDAVKKELQDLDTENKALKKPMDVPNLNSDAEDTAQQMDRALEKLQKQQDKEAKENQQKAAEKMKEMAKKLEDAMQQSEMDQLQEEMLKCCARF